MSQTRTIKYKQLRRQWLALNLIVGLSSGWAKSIDRSKVANLRLAASPQYKKAHRNQCVNTLRTKGYFRFFSLSRHQLKNLADTGAIPGVYKNSW